MAPSFAAYFPITCTLVGYAIVAYTVYSTIQRKGWILFSLHPIFGAAALVCFLIASGQFYQPALNGPAYVRARSRHARLNYLGFACVVVSMAGILIHRIRLNKSLIPHAWHTWVGAFVCVWVLGGMQRVGKLPGMLPRDTAAKLHNTSGLTLALSLGVTCILGYFIMFNKANPAENDITTAIIGSVLIAIPTLIIGLMATPWYQSALLRGVSESNVNNGNITTSSGGDGTGRGVKYSSVAGVDEDDSSNISTTAVHTTAAHGDNDNIELITRTPQSFSSTTSPTLTSRRGSPKTRSIS